MSDPCHPDTTMHRATGGPGKEYSRLCAGGEDTYEVFDDDHVPEVGEVRFHHQTEREVNTCGGRVKWQTLALTCCDF